VLQLNRLKIGPRLALGFGVVVGLMAVIVAQQRVTQSAAEVAAGMRQAEFILLASLVVASLLAIGFGWTITQSVTVPLQCTVEATQLMASGNLSEPIHAQGGDEMAEMQRSLAHRQDSLRALVTDIIGTIDCIAFQTNEVRSLAQRSAEAAREIKSLIQASVEKVDNGTRLVRDAGSAMDDIVGGVKRVTDVIGEISAATTEQSTGLRQPANQRIPVSSLHSNDKSMLAALAVLLGMAMVGLLIVRI